MPFTRTERAMDSVEAEGNSIDAAINAALAMLGTTRDRVDIDILENASRGLFGIGGRKARIRARLRAPLTPASAPPVAPEPAAAREAAPGPARHSVTEPAAGAPAASPADTPVRSPQHAVELGERAAELLEQIAGHLGVSAQAVVHLQDDHLLLDLTGDTSGVLIGRRGQMLDALEYLVNRIVGRDDGATRIRLDSQNYRARRQAALEEMARRMADQAKRKGKAVTLNPMSPQDRRIVHLLLKEDASLVTKSSGQGYYRRLVIIPEGAARTARAPRPA